MYHTHKSTFKALTTYPQKYQQKSIIMVSIKSVPRKIAKLLKNRLESLILRKYSELPLANSHQEEVDENAINEALEARLMELIASAPQNHNLSQAWTVSANDLVVKVPANLDNFPTFQTFCQVAEPQQL